MSVTTRRFAPPDHDAWMRLWRFYQSFYRMEVSAAVSAETWRRILSGNGPIFGFAAMDESGALIGFTHYLFHATSSAIAQRCYLQDLFVDEAARGRGAARALMEAVYDEADKAGSDQVYWLTARDNDVARRLYDRVGRQTSMVKYLR